MAAQQFQEAAAYAQIAVTNHSDHDLNKHSHYEEDASAADNRDTAPWTYKKDQQDDQAKHD